MPKRPKKIEQDMDAMACADGENTFYDTSKEFTGDPERKRLFEHSGGLLKEAIATSKDDPLPDRILEMVESFELPSGAASPKASKHTTFTEAFGRLIANLFEPKLILGGALASAFVVIMFLSIFRSSQIISTGVDPNKYPPSLASESATPEHVSKDGMAANRIEPEPSEAGLKWQERYRLFAGAPEVVKDLASEFSGAFFSAASSTFRGQSDDVVTRLKPVIRAMLSSGNDYARYPYAGGYAWLAVRGMTRESCYVLEQLSELDGKPSYLGVPEFLLYCPQDWENSIIYLEGNSVPNN